MREQGAPDPVQDDDEAVDRLGVSSWPTDPPPPVRHRRRGGVGARILALLALGAFFAAIAALALSSLGGGGSSKQTTPKATTPAPTTPKPSPPPPRPVTKSVHVVGTAAYDPLGDGHENDAEVSMATDGDRSTYWSTARYYTWFKKGVGLVLDAGKPANLTTLRVVTDTPGFAAEVQAGSRPQGPFTHVSGSRTVGVTAVF